MRQMKLLPLILLMFTAFNLTSCDDLEPVDPAVTIPDPTNPTDPGDPTPGVFKADIDGVTYTASMTSVYITGQAIQIGATRAQGDGFAFLLDGTSTGTYNTPDNLLTYNLPGSEFGYWGMHPDNPDQNVGSLTITEIDTANHTISGTFNFTGYWSDPDEDPFPAPKQITNGVFTDIPYVTTSPTNDVFLAKVNGVDFNQNNLLAIETTLTIGDFEIDVISVGAENAAGQSMTVSVKSALTAGSYPITGDLVTDGVQIHFTPNDTSQGAALTSGNVTITEKTPTRIKGTFNGSGTVEGTTYNVTAGSFDVEY